MLMMKPRSFRILERAVEEGFRMGWSRAHKHIDNPDDHTVEDNVTREIMNAICEVFSFDDEFEK